MSKLRAIFWDQDGVIIDTEKDGHRVAFNRMFKESGYDFEWDVDTYGELLQISGGKERMRHYFTEKGILLEGIPEKDDEFLLSLHIKKTAIFVEMIESGILPLRAGVKRLMQEATAAGLRLGVCTTANERSANAIAKGMLGDIDLEFVLAGDVVGKKKPDPEIYLLALKKTGLSPDQCIVIEDSRNGLLAAQAAGMRSVATTNIYTENEDLSPASIVVTSLGDPGGEKGVLKQSARPFEFGGVLHAEQLIEFFSGLTQK
ncbi:MAG: HAD-IA family hydrolase [Deltaproteobacteria bacterium]|jgi:HAD superfamily hydrolase (TIGR01509 family)|nr:HAD-IA family hydrolase [Deltaproteobacteria bacterium]